MPKVLFVCRANAARSQEAEAFYNESTGTKDAMSAGIDLSHSTMGEDLSLPPVVLQVMQEQGYDLSPCRRKALTKEMVEEAAVVISMVTDTPLPDYLSSSPKLIRWNDIPDPVRQPIAVHRVARDLVKKHVDDYLSRILIA